MKKLKLSTVFGVCIATLSIAQAQSPKEIEAAFKSELVGKVITLRNFATGDWLRYKSDGTPLDNGDIGTWTLYAFVEVSDVSVKNDSLVIIGTRRAVVCDSMAKHLSQSRTKLRVRIEIKLDSGANDQKQVDETIKKVVVSGNEQLSDFVPVYWKNYFERNPVLSDQGGCGLDGPEFDKLFKGHQPKSPRADVYEINFKTDVGVAAPKLIHQVDPNYTKEARLAHYEGTVKLRVIVESDGAVGEVWILQPVGLGLDEEAIRCVKQWRFTAATKNGVPVAIYARVDVTFKFKK